MFGVFLKGDGACIGPFFRILVVLVSSGGKDYSYYKVRNGVNNSRRESLIEFDIGLIEDVVCCK